MFLCIFFSFNHYKFLVIFLVPTCDRISYQISKTNSILKQNKSTRITGARRHCRDFRDAIVCFAMGRSSGPANADVSSDFILTAAVSGYFCILPGRYNCFSSETLKLGHLIKTKIIITNKILNTIKNSLI